MLKLYKAVEPLMLDISGITIITGNCLSRKKKKKNHQNKNREVYKYFKNWKDEAEPVACSPDSVGHCCQPAQDSNTKPLISRSTHKENVQVQTYWTVSMHSVSEWQLFIFLAKHWTFDPDSCLRCSDSTFTTAGRFGHW